MSKNNKSKSKNQLKNEVRKLKAAGLYSGDLRKPVTDYARRLTRKYADVLSGEAQVVKVPRAPKGRTKGAVEARSIAKKLAAEYSQLIGAKGERIVVKTLGEKQGERISYSRKRGTITATIGKGEQKRTREFLHGSGVKLVKNERTGEMEYRAVNLPKLKKGQAYVVPSHKKGKLSYRYYYSIDDLMKEFNRYEEWGKNPDLALWENVQVMSRGQVPKPKGRNVTNINKYAKKKGR